MGRRKADMLDDMAPETMNSAKPHSPITSRVPLPVSIPVQVEGWLDSPELGWLQHGFSTRAGGVSTVYAGPGATDQATGDLNLGWTRDDDPANVVENRRRLVAGVAGPSIPEAGLRLVAVRQIHSAVTLIVDEQNADGFTGLDGRAVHEADGLITNSPGILLGIQTADCVPVLVVDPVRRAVAAFHAGWRGTVARIVEQGIGLLGQSFGSRPQDLLAAVGPSIGSCCYSVGDEVFAEFSRNFDYAESLFSDRAVSDGSARHLDLWEANRRQLLAAGVLPQNITVVGECTGCAGLPGSRRYFSHRTEHGFTGRMMSVIGIAQHAPEQ